MRKMHKGGITVFTVLSLSLVVGCLLALLEGTRSYELKHMASLKSQAAIESSFARYNSGLWEKYRLLGNNIDQIKSIAEQCAGSGYVEKGLGTNFLMLKLKDVELLEYTLLTDGEGAAYINAVSAYMEENILFETAKTIYNQYEAIKDLIENHSSDGTEIESAIKSLEEVEKKARGGTQRSPLETIQKLQKTQLLELVVENTDALSSLEYDLDEAVSYRELKEGKKSCIEENDWLDRVFLQQYLLTYLTDYTNQISNRGLNYELEYLIGGKNNDIENLREVVNQLLLIREAANLAYLFSDVEKCQVAETLAWALAGATANAAIVEVVKIGLLVAWAFGESVLDVRALLLDYKIPIIKSKETWTLGIESLDQIGSQYLVAKDCKNGISYKTYLGVLLLFQREKELAGRAMDIQEIALLKEDGSVRFDQLVVRAKMRIVYECAPIFYVFGEESSQEQLRQIVMEKTYGYY